MDEIKNKINQFLDSKKIEQPFLRECVTEFIEGHDKNFGHVVSTEDLFERLEENLDRITFAGENGLTQGEYIKRNENFEEQNEILVYADEADLELSEFDQKNFEIYTDKDKQELLQKRDDKRNDIKGTIIHELTHAAYTKKMEYGEGDSHIFQDTIKDNFADMGASARQSKLMNTGKGHYVEGIANYISTKIKEGSGTYKYQTEAIQMLADKVGEDNVIKAAWESNEDILKTSYINSIGKNKEEGEKSYSSFDKEMRQLSVIEKESDISRYYQRGNETIEHMGKLLEGKTVLSRSEEIMSRSVESKSQKTDLEVPKTGFEDVLNSDVRKSWINKATEYVKNKYREIKSKLMGKETKENEGNEIDR